MIPPDWQHEDMKVGRSGKRPDRREPSEARVAARRARAWREGGDWGLAGLQARRLTAHVAACGGLFGDKLWTLAVVWVEFLQAGCATTCEFQRVAEQFFRPCRVRFGTREGRPWGVCIRTPRLCCFSTELSILNPPPGSSQDIHPGQKDFPGALFSFL